MAGAGKKTFTAGETLTASDVNTYLMEQSVMYFGGTAARASAIPTPSEGMTSYIGVTGTATIPQLETYTGSAWQTPYGSTLVGRAIFSSATTVTIDNCFTSAYDSYLILLMSKNNSANDRGTTLQFRSGGSTIGGTAYSRNQIQSYLTVISAGGTNGTSAFLFGANSQNYYSQTTGIISNASVALPKAMQYHCAHAQSSLTLDTYTGYGINGTSTAYDGLIITVDGGTMTGTLRVYGLRNS